MPNIINTKNFASDATNFIVAKIRDAINSSGACTICLAGGRTPISVYEKLAMADLDWSKIYLAMGDERNVPLDSKESNFKGAYDSLMSKIPIPKEHILNIKTELGMEKAALTYQNELKALQNKLGRDYIFDIMLLGLGGDGHTASLFPNSPALKINDRLVTPNIVNNVFKERITITYPVINSSKEVVIMVNDASKKEVLEKIWAGDDFPAAHVKPASGNLTWIVGE